MLSFQVTVSFLVKAWTKDTLTAYFAAEQGLHGETLNYSDVMNIFVTSDASRRE